MKALELKGQRFGKLTVLERTGSKNGQSAWLCKCDCGVEKIISASNLKTNTFSCGCYHKEIAKKVNTIHGHTHTSLSYIWTSMKQRCFNPNNKAYKNYGGRGISVCEEWIHSFQIFSDYVSQLPHYAEKGYSLDRINNDGNYEPGNVRWATRTEQNNNRRICKTENTNGTENTRNYISQSN